MVWGWLERDTSQSICWHVSWRLQTLYTDVTDLFPGIDFLFFFCIWCQPLMNQWFTFSVSMISSKFLLTMAGFLVIYCFWYTQEHCTMLICPRAWLDSWWFTDFDIPKNIVLRWTFEEPLSLLAFLTHWSFSSLHKIFQPLTVSLC